MLDEPVLIVKIRLECWSVIGVSLSTFPGPERGLGSVAPNDKL